MGAVLAILFIVIIIALIGVAVLYVRKERKNGQKINKIRAGVLVGVALIFFVGFVFIPFGFMQVNAGEIAVVKVWGEAKDVKTSGLHFRNILSTKYEVYDVRTQQMDIYNEVYTKDAQPLEIELTVHYSIMVDKAVEINKTYGTMDMLAQRIEKIAIEKAKVVLSADTAMSLIETRGTLSPKLFAEVKTLEEQYYINVENVVIVDMAFSAAFEKAVEEKMVAQQEVIKAAAEKEKAIIKAEQDLAVAKLAAEQALAKAKGDSDALIEAARGEAESLKLKTVEVARMIGFKVNEITEEIDVIEDDVKVGTVINIIGYEIDFVGSDPELDKNLISDYLKYIAYLETWDGKLPTVVSDAGVFIQVP